MDQLRDSSEEEKTVFVHWYVWIHFATIGICQAGWNLALQIPYYFTIEFYAIAGLCLLLSVPLFMIALLPIMLCLVRRRREWFLIEQGGANPCKLAYRVTKYAYQQETPVQYEEVGPRGLDIGKERYGGCFTSEQVEDVKVFYGILKVLFSFGMVFFLDFAATSVQSMILYRYLSCSTMACCPSADNSMHSSVSLLASPLHLQVCSRDAEENGSGDGFGCALLNCVIFYGHSSSQGLEQSLQLHYELHV